jgi:hypothetical protein
MPRLGSSCCTATSQREMSATALCASGNSAIGTGGCGVLFPPRHLPFTLPQHLNLILSGLDSGFMTLRELMAHCGEYHIAQQEGNMKCVCKARAVSWFLRPMPWQGSSLNVVVLLTPFSSRPPVPEASTAAGVNASRSRRT